MTTKSTNKLSKKVKTLIADLESIILIQEKYIDKIEDLCWFHYDRHIQGWKDNQLWQQVSEYQDKQLEDTTKAYYEVTRAYNALATLGKMAKDLGIDIEKHSSELPENKYRDKYKDWEFSSKSTVLESGKVATEFRMTKPKNKKGKK
jgi:hypothetical protein